jgi:hypothetical protein
MTEARMSKLADKLTNAPRVSLKTRLSHPDHYATHCGFGVYALWEAEKLLYVGHARTESKLGDTPFKGIKSRMKSHREGGGSFGLALLMVKFAPKFKKEDWQKIRSGKHAIHGRTQTYIHEKVSYSWIETTTIQDAIDLERWLHKQWKPRFNNIRVKSKKKLSNI